MKHFKHLLTLLALTMGWGNLWAQTDVTTTYITNADFSSTDGWTVKKSTEFSDIGNGLIGDYTVRFSPATADETHLATEYCFGFECRWSGNFASYSQIIENLPAGYYELSYDVENVNEATTSAYYDNRFYVQTNYKTYLDTQTEWMNGKSNWTTHTISFMVNEPTLVIINFGYGTASNNLHANNTPALYVSHLKLTFSDTQLATAKNALNGHIKKATTLNNFLSDAALATAIDAAQSIYNSTTDYSTVTSATETLAAAINTATSSLTAVALNNGNFDTAPNNTLNADGTTTFGGTLSTATANPDNTKDMSANTGEHAYLYDVAGWTQYSKFNATAAQGTTSEYGTAMPANGWSTNSTIPPATDMLGGNGAALHLSAGWNDQARYMQTINNLPSGRYLFYYEVINQYNYTDITSNYIGVNGTAGDFYGTSNSFVYSDLKSFEEGVWKAQAFEFDIAKESNINFSVGITSYTQSSAYGAKLWIDNILVYRIGEVVVNEADATAIIAEAESLADDIFNADTKAALATALATFQSSQTLDNYNALNAALGDAIASINVYQAISNAILNADIWKDPDTNSTDALHTKYDNGQFSNETTPDDIYAEYQAAEIAGLISNEYSDYTSVILNHNFETGDMTGWQAEIRDDTGVRSNSINTYRMSNVDYEYLFNSWGGTAENNVYQTIKGLPAGTYQLTAVLAGFNGETLTLSANDSKKDFVVTGDKRDGNIVYLVFTLDETTDLTIKASNTKSQETSDASFIKADKFTLKAYSDPMEPLKERLTKLKVEAQDYLAFEDYDCITGSERTVLQTLYDTIPEETEEAYENLINELTQAIAVFKNALSEYNAFAEAKQVDVPELPYASDEKKAAFEDLIAFSPNTAEEALQAAYNLPTALRAYYESNALAEGVEGAVDMTDHIVNPNNPENTEGWSFTAGNFRTMSNEPYTDSDDNYNHEYFDSNSWGTAFTTQFKQDIELEAGTYILTAKARGNGTTTYQLFANDQTTDIGNPGNTGGVFGGGWGDYTVEFEVTEDQTTTTIGIYVETGNSSNWVSFGNFRLMQLSKTEVAMSDEADYAALAEAIASVEGKTLGFDAGEYAPYENVAAVQALAAAQAIDPTTENRKQLVQDATAALTAAVWTANTEEVNAIYDGTLANAPIQATSENVVLPGWKTKVGNTRQTFKGTGEDGKACLADANDEVGLFVHPGTYTYGETAGYTMPLKAGVTYTAEAKYCSWQSGSNKDFTLTILKDGATIATHSFGANNAACTEAEALKHVTLNFKPENDGDYVLNVVTSGNTFMTDFFIMRAKFIPGDVNGDQEVNIADVTALVNAIAKGEQPAAGDLDGVEGVTADDVKALVELILHNQ